MIEYKHPQQYCYPMLLRKIKSIAKEEKEGKKSSKSVLVTSRAIVTMTKYRKVLYMYLTMI
jgi:hypothetical protein